MRFNTLGKSGIRVSAVALGTWAMGGDFWGAIDEQLCIDALHAGLDHGINLIDTAPIYGKGYSEEIVGKAIKGRRDQLVLATKCGIDITEKGGRDASRKAIIEGTEGSLKRLGTDYIDLMQIHWPDPETPVEESMEALLELKKQGKIRAIGVSNFDNELMSRCLALGQLDALQPQYSLLEREIEADILPFCREKGIGILSYGSIGAGLLAGKFSEPPKVEGGDKRAAFYPFFKEPLFSQALRLVDVLKTIAQAHEKPVAHVAINWVAQQEGMSSALVGCKNPAQAIENAAAGDWDLSAAEIAAINKALKEIYGA
ncbi:MAG: aldo/keto reductase [Christensenellaceae bacterium]|jgi:aryl-alcohol dehydrogenase-like predicted oxidoreductase|nr:aldo/keto reductase [Christensenellaceae bacterium]